jgi:hypothetical protein
MAYFTDVKKANCMLQFEQNNSAAYIQRRFGKDFCKEAPTRKSTYKWRKSVAETGCICAKKKNPGNDQVMRLWSMFVRHFSVVRRNPYGGQAGNLAMSLT